MCEFRVYVKDGRDEKPVAEEITYSKILEDELVLKDVLGTSKRLKDTMVDEVDVSKERMVLIQSPLLSRVLRFLDIFQKMNSQREYSDDVEEAWEEVKASGDEMVRSLWKKYGREEG